MLYFDEAGYTGPNLSSVDQPIYTMGSVNFNSDELDLIRRDIGYDAYGKELHFKSMYTNPQGREMLKNVFTHPLMDHSHVLTAYADKRYCIYAQIVDILIEEFYFEQEIDIYQGAKSLVMANLLYRFAIAHPNQTLVHQFEQGFVSMVRDTNDETIANFYSATDQLINNHGTSEHFKNLLSEIPQTIAIIDDALPVEAFHMDVTVALFAQIIQKWYQLTGVKNDVCFDSSEPMFARLEFLEGLRDMHVDETEVGYGPAKHIYPLPIGNISLAKSHENLGIQLADLCASALYFLMAGKSDKYDKFRSELSALPLFDSVDFNLAPASPEFLDQRMNDMDGINPLDFLISNFNNP